MEKEEVLKIEQLSKVFEKSTQGPILFKDLLKKGMKGLFRPQNQFENPLWSLKDISFSVKQGETVGITKREELFNKIESYAKAKYTQKTCESRTPKFEPIVNNKELRFRVVDLCRLVLKDNTSGSICSILNSLGFSCDNSVREMLEFTFSIKEQGTSQATLHILIDGKFGSGYFREVSRGAYQEMEKEPRFESYIEEFSDNFASDLVRYLK